MTFHFVGTVLAIGNDHFCSRTSCFFFFVSVVTDGVYLGARPIAADSQDRLIGVGVYPVTWKHVSKSIVGGLGAG